MLLHLVLACLCRISSSYLIDCNGANCCPENEEVVIILDIDTSFYCQSNNQIDIGYYVNEYDGYEHLIENTKTKVHVIPGSKVDDYLQEFPVRLQPGHYFMRGSQGEGSPLMHRELLIEQNLKLALTRVNNIISVHAISDGTDRFVQQHIDHVKITMEGKSRTVHSIRDIKRRKREVANSGFDHEVGFFEMTQIETQNLELYAAANGGKIKFGYEFTPIVPDKTDVVRKSAGEFQFGPNNTGTSFWETIKQNWVYIVIGAASLLVIIIAVIVICCCKKKSTNNDYEMGTQIIKDNPDHNRSEIHYDPNENHSGYIEPNDDDGYLAPSSAEPNSR